jgi:hypothetical protein
MTMALSSRVRTAPNTIAGHQSAKDTSRTFGIVPDSQDEEDENEDKDQGDEGASGDEDAFGDGGSDFGNGNENGEAIPIK